MTQPAANAPFSALILAGSRSRDDPLAASEGVPHKALIEVEGLPMLTRVYRALRDAGAERVYVSASSEPVLAAARALGASIVAPSTGPSRSVLKALGECGAPLLVTTADHALLRPEWVRRMFDEAPERSDMILMLARRDAVEAAVPASRRTWLRFADGDWSGCNLFLFATPAAARVVELWMRVESDRKRPWRLVARIGPRTLWDYLRGRLGIGEAVARLGRRIGVHAVVVAAADGRAALDVDGFDDLAAVRRLLARDAA